MVDTVKIEGQNNLVRDLSSKAILNTDKSGISKYNRQKTNLNRVSETVQDIADLKSELSTIKALLERLLSEKN